MNARNFVIAAVSAAALLLGAAAPAWAHAVFVNPTVKADTHTELTLDVPVERPSAENSRIEITLPDEFDTHSCTADEGWSCTVNNDRDPEHPDLPQVTFTRVGCVAESSYRCGMEPEKPDGAVMAGQPMTPAGFARVLHGDDGDHDEAGGRPGESFRFLVHTPTKAGDYPVKVIQRYNTGEIVSWDGEAGAKTPAPTIQVR